MPATKKQRNVAGRELRLRHEGKVKRERVPRKETTRPMGSMSDENLKKYSQGIDKHINKLTKRYKETKDAVHAGRLMRAIRQKRREESE